MAPILRSRERNIYDIFRVYKDTIFQRKISERKEEHIYSIFKRNNEEIKDQKSVLMIEYFASRLFVR